MLEVFAVVVSIILGLLSLVTTLIMAGIYIGKLEGFKEFINYRFDQQDKKLEKHNNFITRVYELEKKEAVLEEQIDVANHRIEDLEEVK